MGVDMAVKKEFTQGLDTASEVNFMQECIAGMQGQERAHTFARSPYSSSQDGGCYQQPLQAAAHCAATTQALCSAAWLREGWSCLRSERLKAELQAWAGLGGTPSCEVVVPPVSAACERHLREPSPCSSGLVTPPWPRKRGLASPCAAQTSLISQIVLYQVLGEGACVPVGIGRLLRKVRPRDTAAPRRISSHPPGAAPHGSWRVILGEVGCKRCKLLTSASRDSILGGQCRGGGSRCGDGSGFRLTRVIRS